jgi:hypothetical protein
VLRAATAPILFFLLSHQQAVVLALPTTLSVLMVGRAAVAVQAQAPHLMAVLAQLARALLAVLLFLHLHSQRVVAVVQARSAAVHQAQLLVRVVRLSTTLLAGSLLHTRVVVAVERSAALQVRVVVAVQLLVHQTQTLLLTQVQVAVVHHRIATQVVTAALVLSSFNTHWPKHLAAQ